MLSHLDPPQVGAAGSPERSPSTRTAGKRKANQETESPRRAKASRTSGSVSPSPSPAKLPAFLAGPPVPALSMSSDVDQRKLEKLEARFFDRPGSATPRSHRPSSATQSRQNTPSGSRSARPIASPSSRESSPSRTPRSKRRNSKGQQNSAPRSNSMPSGVVPVPITDQTRMATRTEAREEDEDSVLSGSDTDSEVEELVSFEDDRPGAHHHHSHHHHGAGRDSQASAVSGGGIVLRMTESMMHSREGDGVSRNSSAAPSRGPDSPLLNFSSLLVDREAGASAPPSAAEHTPEPPKSALPAKRSRKFTEAEDALLTAAVGRHGTDWEEVARDAFPNGDRTAEQCKSRWKRLGKKRRESAAADAVAGTSVVGPTSEVRSNIFSPVADNSLFVDLTSPAHSRTASRMDSPHRQSQVFPSAADTDREGGSGTASAVGSPKASAGRQSGRPIYEYFSRRDGAPPFATHRKTVDDEKREAEIKQLAARLQEQTATTHNLQARLDEALAERDEIVRKHAEFRAQAQDQINETLENRKGQFDRARQVLTDLLTQQARETARKRHRKCNEDSLRLASMTVERLGMELQERWEEGYEFQEVEEKLAKIAADKEDCERRRKILAKRRNIVAKPESKDGFAVPEPRPSKRKGSAATMASEEEGPISPQDFAEQDEILKLRVLTLKKEESELNTYLGKLQVERNAHVRELRRIRDENGSRFSGNPILHKRYLLLELLGRGGFSEVWKAFDLNEMGIVAVKIHSLNSAWSDDRKRSYTRHAIREYKIHKELSHPRIIRLWDVFEIDDSSFATVLDFNEGMDLETYLQTVKQIPEREARSIIAQVVSALKYLNELPNPVIHYDLKPGNILLSNGEVRITDFGLSKIIEPAEADADGNRGKEFGAKEMELTSQGAGTYWYLPPEVFERRRDGAPRISSKVDVWSLGVIYYEILFGEKPFANDKSQQSILRTDTITMEAHSLVFPNKPAVSQDTKDFIRKLLEYRKERRPDVLQVAADPYINVVAGKAGKTAPSPNPPLV